MLSRSRSELRAAGLRVEVNVRSDKIGAKIRDAQMQKIPFMLVLGDREMEQGQVAVRERPKATSARCRWMSLSRWRSVWLQTRALKTNKFRVSSFEFRRLVNSKLQTRNSKP